MLGLKAVTLQKKSINVELTALVSSDTQIFWLNQTNQLLLCQPLICSCFVKGIIVFWWCPAERQIKQSVKRYHPESSSFFCRVLPDRLGVLLHRSRGSDCHAVVHLAVLFRWEEAEAVSVLTRGAGRCGRAEISRRTREDSESEDSNQFSTPGTKDSKSFWCSAHHGHNSSDNCRDCFIMQHKHMALKTGSALKSCSYMKNVWTNPICKNCYMTISLTRRISSVFVFLLFSHRCLLCDSVPCDEEKSNIASL